VGLWASLKAWWARPTVDEEVLPAEKSEQMIEWTAQQVKRFGLITPAYIFAEMNRPVMFVYSQFAHFFAPFADAFLGGRAQDVGYLMEDERNLDRFLRRLEELGREEDAEDKARRQARRDARGGRR
jgi:hypothetical protein